MRRLTILVLILLFSFKFLDWSTAAGRSLRDGSVAAQEDETPTHTPVPPTPTNTLLPPTATNTSDPPTATNTPIPPGFTPTNTPQPPTATNTATPQPTSTPTATAEPTNTPVPTATNQAPSISAVADRAIDEDSSTGAIPFTVSDTESSPGVLVVTAASSNTNLVTGANITLGGSGSNRSVKVKPLPNKHGSTSITLTLSDGLAYASTSFNLTVRPVNDAPVVDLNGASPGRNFATNFVTTVGSVKIASASLNLYDIDDTKLSSAVITIANPNDGAAESLTASTAGTAITSSYVSGKLTLSGLDTINHYEQVLRSVVYHNDALPPNSELRTIKVVVNDGNLSSNEAVSAVTILDPRLSIQKSPETQSVPQDDSASFTIVVENSGNVALKQVSVNDPLSPNCEKNLGQLAVGQLIEYSCDSGQISNDFTNIATVQGQDALGNKASDSDSARVEVENPNIQIVKSPSTQTRVLGETATFDVYVINTSATADLTNVEVHDPLVLDCSRSGPHSFTNLSAGQDVLYQCQEENVGAAFTNVITVTAETVANGRIVQDSSIAVVELLDLAATLSAQPTSMPAPGGPVVFNLQVVNSGTVAFTLTSLNSDGLGPLQDPDNPNLNSNDCATQTLPSLEPGEQFICTFSGNINSTARSQAIVVIVEAADEKGNVVTKNAQISIELTRPFPYQSYVPLQVSAYMQPDEENDLPCQAYPLAVARTYHFAADDQDDWYFFDLSRAGDVTVHLRNFAAQDGQLAVWTGRDCHSLDTLMGHNGDFSTSKDVSFHARAGRFYIWIINSDAKAYAAPYAVEIEIR